MLHFVVTLEKNSWYYQDNKQQAGDPSTIDDSKLILYVNCLSHHSLFFYLPVHSLTHLTNRVNLS